MSKELTNEQIRKKLLKLNYDCGPVTDTTREVHLKKLNALINQLGKGKRHNLSNLTDDELRSKLSACGETVAPITSANRHIYLKRLENLAGKNEKSYEFAKQGEKSPYDDFDESEPMEID